jgi:hypothetical protein
MKRYIALLIVLLITGVLIFRNKNGNTPLKTNSNSTTPIAIVKPDIILNEIEPAKPIPEYSYKETFLTLQGKITKIPRIAEDIPYDYVIEIEEPLEGWDQTGNPGGIKEVIIFSEPWEDRNVSQETIDKVKELEGEFVEVTAQIEWGYAEHSHLLISDIKKL